MSNPEIAKQLVAKLDETGAAAAGRPIGLVTIAIEIVREGSAASVEAKVERKTRTLLFMSADAFASDGARVAAATSVHKIIGA